MRGHIVVKTATPVVDGLGDGLLSAVGDTAVVDVSDLEKISVFVDHVSDDPSQTSGAVATLALDPRTANINTVLAAVAPGAAYNVLTMAFVADGSGVGSLTRSGAAYTFHFASGVTTVANFEAAVGALSGDDAMIEVGTPGAAGTLASPGDVFAAASFAGGTDGEGHFTIVLESSIDSINYATFATLTHADYPDGSGTTVERSFSDSSGMPKRARRIRARVTELQDASSFALKVAGSSV